MNLHDRISSFAWLGNKLRMYHENCNDPELQSLVVAAGLASQRNGWFTPEIIRTALNNLGSSLTHESLQQWLLVYAAGIEQVKSPKTVGVVMAGNIPAVGFHDFLCVLLSGHKLLAKLSSSDDRILPAIAALLIGNMPEWQEFITFTNGKLENFDAVIATGSDNSSRYFEFYFGRVPNIIRRNRNSIAILNGFETADDLRNLADDIMLYFGMGCRSVSKVYVPAGYDFTLLINALAKYQFYADHHKYRNNYDYNRSIYMVSQLPVTDTGFILLKEERQLASRIAMLNYEQYEKTEGIISDIRETLQSIQCIVSNMALPFSTLLPGEAQKPALWDYADGVDTLEFLISLQ